MGKMKMVVSGICLLALACAVLSRTDDGEFGKTSTNRTIAAVVTGYPTR